MDYELVIAPPTDERELESPRSACGCRGGAGCACTGCTSARGAQEPEYLSTENEMGEAGQDELDEELRRRTARRGAAQGRAAPPRQAVPPRGRPPSWPGPLPGLRPSWTVRSPVLSRPVLLPWGSPARPVVCDCPVPPMPGSETVRWVQSTLNSVRGLNLPVTGAMTPMVRSALRAFQTDEGLTPDGIASPMTVRALEKYATRPSPEQGTPSAPVTAVDGSGDGDSGADTEPQELEFGLNHGSFNCPPTMGSSFRERVAAIANCEWLRWKKSTIKDYNPAARPFLMDYWMNYKQGSGSTRDAENAVAQGLAWSAVFVSWVMKKAGAGSSFHYAPYHSEYTQAALGASQEGMANHYKAYEINQVKPELGDIICNDRKANGSCTGTSLSNLKDRSGWKKSHGDIVVEVHANRLVVIGGNVSDTVTRREIKLDARGQIPANGRDGCAYFAILKAPDMPAQTGVQPPALKHPPADASPAGNRAAVGLAQKVINMTLEERLDVDGSHGPHTTTGLKLFQCEKSIPRTGRLDSMTLIAITQAALEQVHQQSIFPKPGMLDTLTRQHLAEFRRNRGLSDQAVIDDQVIQALMNAIG